MGIGTSRRLSVAPMMEWTDRHCRYFLRKLAPHTLLYTEMVTAAAVLHGERDRLLSFHPEEHPVALQLGGSDPDALAAAARLGAAAGFDEINLNCGCPSDRVSAGRFGACLMTEHDTVAECVRAMRSAVDVPVTVKCRIGVDDQDSWEHFIGFIDAVANTGCGVFIVHARKAWLKGLSPKQNREIPPLDYARVLRLKQERPELVVVLNGGLQTVASVRAALEGVDGVMLGRAVYHDPWLLTQLEREVFGTGANWTSPHAAVRACLPYIESELTAGTPLQAMTRHLLGFFQGRPGARRWRRYLSEHAHLDGAGADVVAAALEQVPENEGEVDA